MRNKSERILGLDEHRASVEPTEGELGKSQRLNGKDKEPKKSSGTIASQLETKRINGGSMIENKELEFPNKADTKRVKLKGLSKSRELHSDTKASSIERKKLLKSFKSQITLRQKPVSVGGKRTDRKEKKKAAAATGSSQNDRSSKVGEELRSIHSVRGTQGEASSIAGGESEANAAQEEQQGHGKADQEENQKAGWTSKRISGQQGIRVGESWRHSKSRYGRLRR